MSTNLHETQIKYPAIDKQAYVVFRVVKHFKPYILKNHTKVMVPHPIVRSLCVQQKLGEQRVNWITTIQEYDIDIKLAKLVRGQGLCKLVAESHDTLNDLESEPSWENEIEMFTNEILPFLKQS